MPSYAGFGDGVRCAKEGRPHFFSRRAKQHIREGSASFLAFLLSFLASAFPAYLPFPNTAKPSKNHYSGIPSTRASSCRQHDVDQYIL